MQIEFKQTIEPLLSEEKNFVFSRFFDPYYDLLQSVEFYFKQEKETYYFICATHYVEEIFNILAELPLENPCRLLTNYLDNSRDLDFPNSENSIIDDKDNFIKNIQLFIENVSVYQSDLSENDLISVCLYLIEFVKLSRNNELIVQYG